MSGDNNQRLGQHVRRQQSALRELRKTIALSTRIQENFVTFKAFPEKAEKGTQHEFSGIFQEILSALHQSLE